MEPLSRKERFDRNNKIGQAFEARAKGILECIFPDYDVFDTTEVHRVNNKRFPDFLVSNKDKPVCLVDAKSKKVYQEGGKYYLPVSADFIEDYLYHAKVNVGCPCSLIFLVNDNSRTHKGDVYLVEDIEKAPFILKQFNNEHGDSPSMWFDISKMRRLVEFSLHVYNDKG